jgi:AraC-like DNA-binding protein
VGFNSIGAFTVAFSSYAGMTPSAFARRHSHFRIAGRKAAEPMGRSETWLPH